MYTPLRGVYRGALWGGFFPAGVGIGIKYGGIAAIFYSVIIFVGYKQNKIKNQIFVVWRGQNGFLTVKSRPKDRFRSLKIASEGHFGVWCLLNGQNPA
jgi:hypothetical protein